MTIRTSSQRRSAVLSSLGFALAVLCALASAPDGMLPHVQHMAVQTIGSAAAQEQAVPGTDPWTVAGTGACALRDKRASADEDFVGAAEAGADAAPRKARPRITSRLTSPSGALRATAERGALLVSAVAYCDLTPGKRYELVATLHGADEGGGPLGSLNDASGNPIRARTLFTPSKPKGEVQAKFHLDTSGLGGARITSTVELKEAGGHLVSAAGYGRTAQGANGTVAIIDEAAPRDGRTQENAGESLLAAMDAEALADAFAAEAASVMGLLPFSIAGLALARLSVTRLRSAGRYGFAPRAARRSSGYPAYGRKARRRSPYAQPGSPKPHMRTSGSSSTSKRSRTAA